MQNSYNVIPVEKILDSALTSEISLSILSSVMAVNSCEECQNVHSVVVLNDPGTTDQQYVPPSNINYSEVPKVLQSQVFLNAKPGLLNLTDLDVDKVNNYAPCILDVDIEIGKTESLKSNDGAVANSKSDDSLPKALQRDICLHLGGKFMQLLMNHGIELPKFTSRERVYDSASSRSRKYKRSHSFNSRKVQHGNNHSNLSDTESEANQ